MITEKTCFMWIKNYSGSCNMLILWARETHNNIYWIFLSYLIVIQNLTDTVGAA